MSEERKGRVLARMRYSLCKLLAKERPTEPAPRRETLQLQQLPLVPRRDHTGRVSSILQQQGSLK